MTEWPRFETKDLGPDDDAEMLRRWTAYNEQMQVIIARGGVHQDADGWWVETATGELIGPDPEIERPLADGKQEEPTTFAEVMRKQRGRPKLERPKERITIRLSAEVMDHYRATGPGWQGRIDDALMREVRRRRT